MAIKTVQVTINGSTTNLTYNSNTKLYEGNLTAPGKSSYNVNAGHYYPVTVKATDDAGNSATVSDVTATVGEKLRLRVKETTKPVITVTSPTEGAITTNNKPVIQWKITDNDSGVKSGTIGIIIDDGNKITDGIVKSTISGGYQCSYTALESLPDGNHTFKFDASDNDDNAAVQRTLNIKIDTVPPSLSVDSPANNLITNNASIVVSGIATDITSNPVTVGVRLNNGTMQNASVGTNGTFSTNLTLAEGTNTIVVTATDAAGKTSSVTRVVTLDTQAPVISDINISPNPVSTGEILNIQVTVAD